MYFHRTNISWFLQSLHFDLFPLIFGNLHAAISIRENLGSLWLKSLYTLRGNIWMLLCRNIVILTVIFLEILKFTTLTLTLWLRFQNVTCVWGNHSACEEALCDKLLAFYLSWLVAVVACVSVKVNWGGCVKRAIFINCLIILLNYCVLE
jgi:hypothetical protein